MITFGISNHGPYAGWHIGLRRRPRSFRHTLTYWVLGLWAVEIVFWMTAGMLIGCWWVLRLVGPHLFRAGRSMLVGLRIAAKVTLHV